MRVYSIIIHFKQCLTSRERTQQEPHHWTPPTLTQPPHSPSPFPSLSPSPSPSLFSSSSSLPHLHPFQPGGRSEICSVQAVLVCRCTYIAKKETTLEFQAETGYVYTAGFPQKNGACQEIKGTLRLCCIFYTCPTSKEKAKK